MQILLMLKQTVESTDRARVLYTGDEHSYVDLGTFFDLIHGHDRDAILSIQLSWNPGKQIIIYNPEYKNKKLFETDNLTFRVEVKEVSERPIVQSFDYSFNNKVFGMKQKERIRDDDKYQLISDNFEAKRYQGRVWPLPSPVKCYGFPDEVTGYYRNVGFLSEFVRSFHDLFSPNMAYLGPLREYPKRSYVWDGASPLDVGRVGERTVSALLSSRNKGKIISPGKGKHRMTVEERIGYWLREMGLVDSYTLKPIAENRKDYELRVKTTKDSPEVLITDVGFGVSQILPVLVLCYYMPEGSIIILEQPEIHLHPSVQAWLADVFIEVVTSRNIQIIVESHSEHLLTRLQRRIAEKKIDSDKTALYFCQMKGSSSDIERLDVDLLGSIRNWPDDFFGDKFSDLAAMTLAGLDQEGK